MSQPRRSTNQLPSTAPATSRPAAARSSGLLQLPEARRGRRRRRVPVSAASSTAATAGFGLLGRRLLLLRLPRLRRLQQVRQFHAAHEARHLLAHTERAAVHPPPVGLDDAVAELVPGGQVRRGRALGGRRVRLPGGPRRTGPRDDAPQHPLRPLLRLGLALHGDGGGGGAPRRTAGAFRRCRHDLVGAAHAGQDAPDGGGRVDGDFRAAPVDLVAQVSDQAHPGGRRQLPLLGHVADAAQILVNDLVALNPHEVPSGAGALADAVGRRYREDQRVGQKDRPAIGAEP